jgi:hypothetical protein
LTAPTARRDDRGAMDARSASPSQDRCLTDSEIASMRTGSSDVIPNATAQHIAACGLCQQRLLSSELPPKKRRDPGKPREVMPSIGRALVLAGLLVAAIALFLLTLRRLLGD